MVMIMQKIKHIILNYVIDLQGGTKPPYKTYKDQRSLSTYEVVTRQSHWYEEYYSKTL